MTFPLSAGRVNDDDLAYANAGGSYGTGGRAQRRAAAQSGGGSGQGVVAGAVAAGLAVLLLLGFLITRGSGGGSGDGETVAVPDVIGFTQVEAEQELTGQGFVVQFTDPEASDTYEAGKVVRQSPTSSLELASGGTVTLTVSAGPAPVEVPQLAGVTELSAKSQLTAAGLGVGEVRQEPSNEWAAGQVVKTEPAAGQQLAPGTAVVIVVSSGPSTVLVPNNLEGQTYDQAVASLQAVGLTANRVDVEQADADAGEVVGVENAGGQVNAGSAVTVYVSTGGTGQGRVIVPNVVGLGAWEADSRLRQAGLNPNHVGGGLFPGAVVSQNPSAGTQVRSGTDVDIRFEND